MCDVGSEVVCFTKLGITIWNLEPGFRDLEFAFLTSEIAHPTFIP
jgi:hypothetical protein